MPIFAAVATASRASRASSAPQTALAVPMMAKGAKGSGRCGTKLAPATQLAKLWRAFHVVLPTQVCDAFIVRYQCQRLLGLTQQPVQVRGRPLLAPPMALQCLGKLFRGGSS